MKASEAAGITTVVSQKAGIDEAVGNARGGEDGVGALAFESAAASTSEWWMEKACVFNARSSAARFSCSLPTRVAATATSCRAAACASAVSLPRCASLARTLAARSSSSWSLPARAAMTAVADVHVVNSLMPDDGPAAQAVELPPAGAGARTAPGTAAAPATRGSLTAR